MALSQKRSKPKQKLSPLQEKRFLRIAVALVAIAVLWVVLAPGSGLLSFWNKRQELQSLQEKTLQLEEENQVLRHEIDRLQNDPEYLEELARKQYGLLKKHERVFEFNSKKSTKEKD